MESAFHPLNYLGLVFISHQSGAVVNYFIKVNDVIRKAIIFEGKFGVLKAFIL